MGRTTAAFLRHPILASVVSGLVLFGWGYGVLRFDLWFCAAGAVAMGCVQWFLWRPHGWARRREERIHNL